MLTTILIGIVLLNSCQKFDKLGPNNFTKKSTWQVTEITIGGDLLTSLPQWKISTTESSIWCHNNGTCTNFSWVFSQNNNFFEFFLDNNDSYDDVNSANKQCDNLSGIYHVMTSKKNMFEFETNETLGYIGPRVYIRVE